MVGTSKTSRNHVLAKIDVFKQAKDGHHRDSVILSVPAASCVPFSDYLICRDRNIGFQP